MFERTTQKALKFQAAVPPMIVHPSGRLATPTANLLSTILTPPHRPDLQNTSAPGAVPPERLHVALGREGRRWQGRRAQEPLLGGGGRGPQRRGCGLPPKNSPGAPSIILWF